MHPFGCLFSFRQVHCLHFSSFMCTVCFFFISRTVVIYSLWNSPKPTWRGWSPHGPELVRLWGWQAARVGRNLEDFWVWTGGVLSYLWDYPFGQLYDKKKTFMKLNKREKRWYICYIQLSCVRRGCHSFYARSIPIRKCHSRHTCSTI